MWVCVAIGMRLTYDNKETALFYSTVLKVTAQYYKWPKCRLRKRLFFMSRGPLGSSGDLNKCWCSDQVEENCPELEPGVNSLEYSVNYSPLQPVMRTTGLENVLCLIKGGKGLHLLFCAVTLNPVPCVVLGKSSTKRPFFIKKLKSHFYWDYNAITSFPPLCVVYTHYTYIYVYI